MTTAQDLRDWRRQVLDRAGFPPPLADELAGEEEVDLHDLLALVDRGGAPALAARIVAPR